jgi:two-component system phosphate regulon sensor histidine kinase PhoR
LRATATPIGDDGTVLVVVRDVTEARRLDAVRRDFVANASHELKTPVASIQAAAETLITVWHDDPDAVPRFAQQLDREAVRLSRIVADLLDLSRLESGSELHEQVRMDALVREEAERFDATVVEARLTMRVEAPAVPTVRGSGRDLSLLVRNLLDNAIRYTPLGGRVDISVRRDGDRVRIDVVDDGPGISAEEMQHVFDPFYRVLGSDAEGSGLGLAIVRVIVSRLGGTVTLANEATQGLRVQVDLPAADGMPAEAPLAEAADTPVGALGPAATHSAE